jgi:uncharacterized membrane protein YbaN (DUF454 family)
MKKSKPFRSHELFEKWIFQHPVTLSVVVLHTKRKEVSVRAKVSNMGNTSMSTNCNLGLQFVAVPVQPFTSLKTQIF